MILQLQLFLWFKFIIMVIIAYLIAITIFTIISKIIFTVNAATIINSF